MPQRLAFEERQSNKAEAPSSPISRPDACAGNGRKGTRGLAGSDSLCCTL